MDKLNGKILVVDDDPEMCSLLFDVLSEAGHTVELANDGKQALIRFSDQIDLVITDLELPEMKGLELMHQVKRKQPGVSVIIITGFGTIESAIEAMKLGAYDYIPKPFKVDELLLGVQKALQEGALRQEVARLRKEIGKEYQFGNLIGKSKSMQGIFDLIRRIAGTASNILITGESGTGKDLVAKALHYNSPRKGHPFIPVNCAAIPEQLLESELFGHMRGAFTDAKGDKAGLFEEANGGTLFLDEISELPISLQAKLLRVLQDREIRRVGANHFSKVDVRIIAASNSDLAEEVKQHHFRADLFYRLNVIHFVLPPLRERKNDILPLAYHFLKKYQKETGKQVTGISEPSLSYLLRYPWAGNVRELENAIERAVILARGEQIIPEDFPSTITGGQDDFVTLEKALEEQMTLEELEFEYISKVLKHTGGNKYKAAQILGIDRKTLYRKLGKTEAQKSAQFYPDSS
ncbi:MAG TPA: sigma-54 dependent transcriptional regulator [Nitrospiria bacterium]|jgi:DNA-binding NtrC family response regulator